MVARKVTLCRVVGSDWFQSASELVQDYGFEFEAIAILTERLKICVRSLMSQSQSRGTLNLAQVAESCDTTEA